jgi:hypothetical protein
MLSVIKSKLKDRRDRQELSHLRVTMADIQKILSAEDESTGALVRMKVGLHLQQRLESRFGIMGADFLDPVFTDDDLERERKLLDRLHPERLGELAAQLGRSAERTLLDGGDPETRNDGPGESAKNAAAIVALRLLSGWVRSKCILQTSTDPRVIEEAREREDLFFSHIQGLLRSFRGEEAADV